MLTANSAIAFAIVFAAAGCSSIARTAPREADHRAAREREAEYSVYSHFLRLYQTQPNVRISDSTQRVFGGAVSLCSQSDRKPGYCVSPRPGTSVEMWSDYVQKNQRRSLLLPLFDPDVNIPLERNAPPVEITCRAPTTIHFSRVGLNPDLTQAIVQVTYITGKGPMPGCGFTATYAVVVERTKTGWRELMPVGGAIS